MLFSSIAFFFVDTTNIYRLYCILYLSVFGAIGIIKFALHPTSAPNSAPNISETFNWVVNLMFFACKTDTFPFHVLCEGISGEVNERSISWGEDTPLDGLRISSQIQLSLLNNSLLIFFECGQPSYYLPLLRNNH